MKPFLTVEDVAELFSKHKNTIYKWIEEGVFPGAFKVKDGWYVPVADIRRLIRQSKQANGAAAKGQPARSGGGFVTGWRG